jgi:hypothetical protein
MQAKARLFEKLNRDVNLKNSIQSRDTKSEWKAKAGLWEALYFWTRIIVDFWQYLGGFGVENSVSTSHLHHE